MCCTNLKKEEKSEGDYFKHRIIVVAGFMLFFDCINNLKNIKGKCRVLKAKGRCKNGRNMNTILHISSVLIFLATNNRKSKSKCYQSKDNILPLLTMAILIMKWSEKEEIKAVV